MTRVLAAVSLVCLACGDGSGGTSRGDGSGTPDTITTAGRIAISPSRQGEAVTRFLAGGQTLGTTEVEIRKRLGPPDSVVVSPIPSGEDARQTDTLVRLYYDTQTFGLYRDALSHHDVLSEVIVDTTGAPAVLGLGVGSSRQDVVSALGPPRHIDRDRTGVETLEYNSRDDGSTVRFLVLNNIVRRIEWNYIVP